MNVVFFGVRKLIVIHITTGKSAAIVKNSIVVDIVVCRMKLQ